MYIGYVLMNRKSISVRGNKSIGNPLEIRENTRVDIFPRTNGADFCLFTVTGQYPDIKMEQSCHVETVVLLSKAVK